MSNFDFNNLFVLDLANNHQGNVEHGLKIIHECGKMVRKHNIRAAIKFQFRQYETFIHPDHLEGSDNIHIPRFLATQLKLEDWQILFDAVKEEGMLTMCTPFDNESVPIISKMGFDVIKVASCSAKDWPLLEEISKSMLPIIASTGGLDIENIDDIVSFFAHRGNELALMHCVSIYPIPTKDFHLNHIDTLKDRYQNHTIGWSTHENQDEVAPVQIAMAKGAKMFERHVGYETKGVTLNLYSSSPKQLDSWFKAYRYAEALCGLNTKHVEKPTTDVEKKSLEGLQRGVFAKKDIKKDTLLDINDVYFAMPFVPGQISSESWVDGGVVVNKSFKVNEPLFPESIKINKNTKNRVLKKSIHEFKAMLSKSSIVLNSEFGVEFSHHHGAENFREVGALIIDCINREYCKKLILVLPGQRHPSHYHKKKEETFQVLSGVFESVIDGHHRVMKPGDIALVQPGVWHEFWSKEGCIVEEVSTTHYDNDSVYNNKKINDLARTERKTAVKNWGRFELVEGD
jgi:sialic acid synthase SpsE/quercetin dioxygenase-like cupin family protein